MGKHLVQSMHAVNAQIMYEKMMVNTRVPHRKVLPCHRVKQITLEK